MPLLWLSTAFFAGILLAGAFAPPGWVYAVVAAVGALLILAERLAPISLSLLRNTRNLLRFPAGLLFVFLALGGLRYQAGQMKTNPDSLAYYNDRGVYTITALVSAAPDRREDAVYLELSALEIEDPRAAEPLLAVKRVSGKARARFAPGARWQAGDVLRFSAAPLTPADEGAFSYKDYLERQHIATVIYDPRSVQLVGARGAWFSRGLERIRQRVKTALFALYPQPESGLLAGILLGLDQYLPESLEKAYQQTGTAHIIAISGFNMAVLAFLFMWVFNRLFNRYWAAALSALFIALYAVFVGGTASVVRAALMAVSAFGGHLIGRRQSGINALGFTAALMCVFNPTLPWDVSFQLSFAATLGLMLFAEPLHQQAVELLQKRLPENQAHKIAAPLSEYFLYTLAAQLATLPIIAWHFGRVSLSSLLANPLVLPAQPPLLVLSGLSAVTGTLLPAAGKVLAVFAWPLAAYTNRVVALLSRFNTASLALNHSTALWLLVFVVVFVLLFLLRGYFKKIFKGNGYWLLFLLVLACFSVWSMLMHRPDGRLHLRLLRAGDESTLTASTPAGRVLVFDPRGNLNDLSAAVGQHLSPWRYYIDETWFAQPAPAAVLERLQERVPLRSVVLAPVIYRAGAGVKPFSAPQGIEVIRLQPGGGLRYSHSLDIRVVAESNSAAALLITYDQVKVLIPNGVDYALIKATSPLALQALSLVVVGEEDISYIPPRVWQALAPAAILWRDTTVCPVEGWLNLGAGDALELVADGKTLSLAKQ